ncbi:MAG: hypothetical protein IT160_19245 [Bryobacterales bacterium]|nr:hypothetical protein [Bryobacterales bacterium]
MRLADKQQRADAFHVIGRKPHISAHLAAGFGGAGRRIESTSDFPVRRAWLGLHAADQVLQFRDWIMARRLIISAIRLDCGQRAHQGLQTGLDGVVPPAAHDQQQTRKDQRRERQPSVHRRIVCAIQPFGDQHQ